MKRETFATDDETSHRITSFGRSFLRCLKTSSNGHAAVGHVAAQRLVQVELALLEPPAADREHVLDALREPAHHLAHLRAISSSVRW